MKDLDIKDKKLLYLLDRNSRTSNAELGRKLRMSKETIYYRINRLIEKGYIKKFYTIINVAKIGYFSFKVYFQFQNMDSNKEKEFIEYLLQHKRVFWIATCSGTWELIIGTWAKNVIDFNDNIMNDILNKYSQYILNKAITITKHNIQWNRRWTTNSNDIPITSDVGGAPDFVELDKIDTEILKYLANNARMPIVEITNKIGTTPSIVNYRIKQMINNGVILSFRIALDLTKFNLEFCKSFIYFQNYSSEKEKKLVEYCKNNRNILNVVSCIGSWDLEMEFEVESFEKFHTMMKDIKEKFGDIVKNYESVLISDEPRVDFFPECYLLLSK